jgi:RimJ/RimL family protein N-acetyltransferase
MEIRGPGFTLRDWRTDDAASLQKHADNRRIFNYLLDRFPSPYTMADAVSWIALMQHQDPFVTFAIAIDGELAGAIGIELRPDIYRKTALIGYWLGETYWGRGIMPEAVKLVTEYAFTNFDLIRLQAGILGNNPKSMRVLEKAGFTKEGILKKAIIKNGEILDEHLYALIKA